MGEGRGHSSRGFKNVCGFQHTDPSEPFRITSVVSVGAYPIPYPPSIAFIHATAHENPTEDMRVVVEVELVWVVGVIFSNAHSSNQT